MQGIHKNLLKSKCINLDIVHLSLQDVCFENTINFSLKSFAGICRREFSTKKMIFIHPTSSLELVYYRITKTFLREKNIMEILNSGIILRTPILGTLPQIFKDCSSTLINYGLLFKVKFLRKSSLFAKPSASLL